MMAQFGSAMKRLRTTFKKILPEGSSRSSSISERRPPAEASSADKSYTRHLTGAAGTDGFEITTAFGSTSLPLPNPVTVKMKLDAVRGAGLSPVFFIDEVGMDKRSRHFHTSANVYKARIVRPPQYGSSEHSLSSIPGSATQKHMALDDNVKVFQVDEYCTSCRCHRCGGETIAVKRSLICLDPAIWWMAIRSGERASRIGGD
ncbi:hypothetical protein DFQ27_002725 [Actinomortierella ambigua]|uniref:Transposase n=1 Tax=Actinomortierella ambigua TaxID=1343610 RepID=A0A9P6U6X9_9FUNG|nr:hypothetical protein DFQ27_002725 [Actinomortierella ambigua]